MHGVQSIRPPFRPSPCYVRARHEPLSPNSCDCAGRPADRGRRGVGASARLGHDEERGGLRARRHGRPACATPGPSTTCTRPSPRRAWRARRRASSRREELQPLAQVNVKSLKEYDFFTFAKANGKKVSLRRSGRLLPRVQSQGHGADAALHAAAEDAGEGDRRSTSRCSIRAISSISPWPRRTR